MEWSVAAIGDVCEPTEQRDPRNDPAGEFHYVDIAGIDRVHKSIVEHQTLLGTGAPSRARKVIRKGDVLVSTVRPNLNAVAMVPACLDGQIASTGFCVLRPNRVTVEPRYLFYWTTSSRFVAALTSLVRGANYPAVSDRDVKEVSIPLPPLVEQRRIVEILDQADRLRRLRAEADAKADRILPALFIKMFGDPATNPMGWDTKPFREILTEPPRNGLSPTSGGTFRAKVLTLSAITGTRFDETAGKDGYFGSRSSANKEVDFRDFLVCRGNGNLGLVGRARFPHRTLSDTLFPDTMIAARVNPKQVDRSYLEALWHTKWMRLQIESRSTTTSGIHKINQATLGSVPVRLPPLPLQIRFGSLSSRLRRGVEVHRTDALDRLFGSLSHRAFL